MKPKIYITRKLPEAIIKKLAEACEVKMWDAEDIPVPYEVLEKEIQEVEGLLCLLTENITEDLISKAKNLKIIANMAAGYNNIDVNSAAAQGVLVTNTPGVLTETTADLTFALLMATARRLTEASDYLKEGEWKTWSPMQLTGQDIHGSTLGIIGLGQIGEALVKRAKGFDMDILYYNRSRKHDKEEKLDIKFVSLADVLKKSDFVCIMTPYTPETHHLIGKEQLAMMKENAILINTARGGIVDEEALFKSLSDKKIWGAGIDVFQDEPVPVNHPLLALPNVISLPHIGSASVATRMKMANLAAMNLLQGITGSTPDNLVKI